MTNIAFRLNMQLDAQNWYYCARDSFCGVDWVDTIPSEILVVIKNGVEHEVMEALMTMLEWNYAKTKLESHIVDLNKWRNDHWWNVFSKMETIVGKSIPVKDIICNITTVLRCPYDPNEWSFMYCPFDEDDKMLKKPETSIQAITHELLHLMLHYYFEDYIKSCWLTDDEFHTLKEAQTVILNEEYRNMFTSPDRWYEIHQELRCKLAEFRKQNKDFSQFVDYWIMTVKSVMNEG